MISILSILVLGLLTGRYLPKPQLLKLLSGLMMPVVWLLLFFMGLHTGSLPQLKQQWLSLGRDAVLIALGATLGSVIMAWILSHSIKRLQTLSPSGAPAPYAPAAKRYYWLTGPLTILSSYLAGVFLAYQGWAPPLLLNPLLSFGILCFLMFLAGLHTGQNRTLFETIRRVGFTPLWVPTATLIGTLAGTALIIPLLPGLSATDTLAIGSGMGYYSLSSLLIAKARGAELGTIALMANMARELMALIFAPLLARYFGKLAPITAGGATTMDTTLPGILRASGHAYLFISLVNGFFTDLSVPLLVAFFLSF